MIAAIVLALDLFTAPPIVAVAPMPRAVDDCPICDPSDTKCRARAALALAAAKSVQPEPVPFVSLRENAKRALERAAGKPIAKD